MKPQREPMSKGRLEAFTDNVIAVIITLLVLNLRAPGAAGWAAWKPGLLPAFIYAIGFQLTAAMWLLHHNIVVRIEHVNRKMVWANFVFLLFLSLFPLTLQAVSLHPKDATGVVIFCGDALFSGLALSIFRTAAARDHADDPVFVEWNARRSRLAMVLLGSVGMAMLAAFYSTYISLGLIATTFLLVLLTG
jgi:uncharacterized membrane protein